MCAHLDGTLTQLWLCFEQNGNAAASLSVAEQYVSAFSNLAKESNTILLPSNSGDISGMVTQVCLCFLSYLCVIAQPIFPGPPFQHTPVSLSPLSEQ